MLQRVDRRVPAAAAPARRRSAIRATPAARPALGPLRALHDGSLYAPATTAARKPLTPRDAARRTGGALAAGDRTAAPKETRLRDTATTRATPPPAAPAPPPPAPGPAATASAATDAPAPAPDPQPTAPAPPPDPAQTGGAVAP